MRVGVRRYMIQVMMAMAYSSGGFVCRGIQMVPDGLKVVIPEIVALWRIICPYIVEGDLSGR